MGISTGKEGKCLIYIQTVDGGSCFSKVQQSKEHNKQEGVGSRDKKERKETYTKRKAVKGIMQVKKQKSTIINYVSGSMHGLL